MPAVSVIILVYKVERYIEQCARSLFGQTLEDLEYIFVDDCTPDDSIAILNRVLDEYPGRRSQVKILHNDVNRGQAYSRRRGIEASSGEYIIHCDSDDWIEPEMYAKMYDLATREGKDMVICSASRHFSDHAQPVPGVTYSDDLIKTLLFQDVYYYLWNKLVVRRAYEGVLYWPEYNICEDMVLVFQLAYHCRSWGFVEDSLYNYRFVSESITSLEDTIEKVEHIRNNVDLVLAFLDDKGLSERYRCAILYYKYWVKQMAMNLPRSYYLHLYPETNLALLFDWDLSVAERLGHLTKLLGIHGVSKSFLRKK